MIDVLAAVIVRGEQVLLAKRSQKSSQGGLWEFPGGKLEDGETHQECLVRDLEEELAETAEVGDFVAETVHTYPEKTIRLIAYFVSIDREPKAEEHERVAWVNCSELLDYNLAPADKPIAKAVMAKMTGRA